MKAKAFAVTDGALLVAACLGAGCHERHDYQVTNRQSQVLDAVQDPGAHLAAANELSQQLIAADPGSRRAWFRTAIIEAGHRCNLVTSAVIKGGDGDMDTWRVGCDAGSWLVTLGPGNSRSVESCSKIRSAYCIDGLKQLEWPREDS